MKSKLVIGTANFGQSYGAGKYKTKLSFRRIKEILIYANKHGIKSLDTAHSYGNAEKIIGKLNFKTYKVLTKLPKLPKNLFSNDQNLINPLNGKQFHSIKWKTKSH